MKKLISLVALWCFVVIGAYADYFTPVTHPNSAQDRTVIYFDLEVNDTIVSPYGFSSAAAAPCWELAAFIGGECRAVASVETAVITIPGTDITYETDYLVVEVPGNFGPDNVDDGKTITFKLLDKRKTSRYQDCVYVLQSDQEVKYGSEKTWGEPSGSHVILSVVEPKELLLSDITMNVGDNVTLTDYLTVTPYWTPNNKPATLPENYTWEVGNYPSYVTIEGDQLTANEVGTLPLTLEVPGITGGSSVSSAATLTIKNPATAINTVTTLFSVNVGDEETLNNFLTNKNNKKAYSLMPAGSTDVVDWVIADNTIVRFNASNAQYSPLKKGETTMTPVIRNNDGVVRLSGSPITINVLQPVTELSVSVYGITCNMGDTDIKSRLEALITILPSEASNTELDWEIIRGQGVLRLNTDKSLTPLKPGTEVVQASTKDGSGLSVMFNVTVEDPATVATFKNAPLLVSITTNNGTDIRDAILNNIELNGTTTRYSTITLTDITPSDAVEGSGSINDKGIFGDFTAYKTGTATVNVEVGWNDYSKGEWVSQNYTFQLQISENISLSQFNVTVTPDATNKTTGTVTLTPVPSNATINGSDYELVAITPQVYDPWVSVTFTRTSTNPLTFSYTGKLPGSTFFWIKNTKTQASVSTGAMSPYVDIPYAVELSEGWQWKSFAWGYATDREGLQTLFGGDKLAEARTQQKLLYNDPSWGYVGSLTSGGIDARTMFKAKMNAATTSYLTSGFETFTSLSIALQPGWNWVGSPYFYNRQLSEVISASSLPSGTVIVSKTASAEVANNSWNGNLSTINSGEGYLVYNPSNEAKYLNFDIEVGVMAQENAAAGSRAVKNSLWKYDASRFANNMTMVAQVRGHEGAGARGCEDSYSVGAFVGDECRGEGETIDGRIYVTVHADNGEKVSFRLYNKRNGEYSDVMETVTARQRVGSYKNPFVMTKAGDATGINEVCGATNDEGVTKRYDLLGREGIRTRISIVRMSDGTVRKVVTAGK